MSGEAGEFETNDAGLEAQTETDGNIRDMVRSLAAAGGVFLGGDDIFVPGATITMIADGETVITGPAAADKLLMERDLTALESGFHTLVRLTVDPPFADSASTLHVADGGKLRVAASLIYGENGWRVTGLRAAREAAAARVHDN